MLLKLYMFGNYTCSFIVSYENASSFHSMHRVHRGLDALDGCVLYTMSAVNHVIDQRPCQTDGETDM